MPSRPRRADPSADLKRYLGARVEHFREEQGLTQASLAAASGIPESSISRIARGRANATLSTLDKLAKALRIKASQLLP